MKKAITIVGDAISINRVLEAIEELVPHHCRAEMKDADILEYMKQVPPACRHRIELIDGSDRYSETRFRG